jgi:class 3 adenylate cyclase/tetratricopeptide (TPR) repeat protein
MASGRPETVTVLFTDVVDSTGWRVRVGGWRADEQSIDLERATRDVVAGHGGVVVKSLGDGVMATFTGAVSAFEAGVALQLLARRLGVGDGLRVGISSGDLVRVGDDWVGDAAIEASRLCGEAAGGSILVTDVAVLLAGPRLNHELRDVGRRVLRGFQHGVGVHELVARAPVSSLPPGIVQALDGPLVGRHVELARLAAMLQDVAAGATSAVVIVGEPGVGKSRLAAAAAVAADERGFRILYARCDQGQGPPFGPIVEAFRPWIDDCPTPVLARAVGLSGGEALVQVVPDLSERLGVKPFEAGTDPQVRRWLALEALTGLVRAMADEQPSLLVIDDLQWAEPSTRLALGHLVEKRVSRYAVLATARRPDDRGTMSPLPGATERGVDVITLDGLDRAGVAELVAARVGDEPPDGLAEALRLATNGNPFFLGAVLTHLETGRRLRQSDGGWITSSDLADAGVPEAVRDMIRERMAGLTEPARRVLQIGAVVGLAFDEATTRAAAGIDLASCVEAVERCVAAGLVREVDAGRFEFAHAIVRQTVLDDLSRTRLAALHWRVAEALEAAAPGSRRSEVAMHYAAGIDVGQPATVARAAREAGDEAASATAFDEAAEHYRTLVGVLDRLAVDTGERHAALVALGRALNAIGDVDAAGPAWLEAAALARSLGDPRLLFDAARGYGALAVDRDDDVADLLDDVLGMLDPGDSPLKAMVLGWRAVPTPIVQSKRHAGVDTEMLAEAVAMARRTRDVAAIAMTLRSRSLFEGHTPDAEAMRRDLEEAIELERTHGVTVSNDSSALLGELAIALLRLGRRKRAEGVLAQTWDEARRNGLRQAGRWVARTRAAIAAANGRFAEAKRLARDALGEGPTDLATQLGYGAQTVAIRLEQGRLDEVISGLREFDRLGLSARAWSAMLVGALAADGQLDEAKARLDELIAARRRGEQSFADQLTLRHLAETCRRLNDAATAEQLLPEMERWTGQLLVVPYGTSIEGAADRARGQLLATLGRHNDADGAFSAAVQLERAVDFPALAARSSFWHARTLLERAEPGDRKRATEMLDEVHETAHSLGMSRLAEEAHTLAATAT